MISYLMSTVQSESKTIIKPFIFSFGWHLIHLEARNSGYYSSLRAKLSRRWRGMVLLRWYKFVRCRSKTDGWSCPRLYCIILAVTFVYVVLNVWTDLLTKWRCVTIAKLTLVIIPRCCRETAWTLVRRCPVKVLSYIISKQLNGVGEDSVIVSLWSLFFVRFSSKDWSSDIRSIDFHS